MKNMELRYLEDVEEVAEVAVNRCRNRLLTLQNRIEKRKEMLKKTKETLAVLKVDNLTEDSEDAAQILENRKSGIEENITLIKSCQRNMDEKIEVLLTNLEEKASRIIDVDKKLMDEKNRLVDMTQEIERSR